MKHLYLMRHGETLFNVLKKIQGWCDSPLTDNGIQQAKEAGKKLEGIPFDHYYCSTAERAVDTLEIATNYQVPYTRLKGLKERYFSVFEGESESLNPQGPYYDEIFPKYGGETSDQVADRLYNTISALLDQDDHQCILCVSHAGAIMTFSGRYMDMMKFRKEHGFPNCGILHFTYEDGNFTFVEML